MIVIDAAPGRVLPAAITVVIIEAAGTTFAMPAPAVAQITAPVPITPLPLVPAFVDGLVGLGGAILPQIDLRRRLGLPGSETLEGGELLVMMAVEGNYALRVDHVMTLAAMEGDTIQVFEDQTVPNMGAADLNLFSAGMVAGQFPWRGRTVLLLHPERIGLEGMEARSPDEGTGNGGIGVGSASIAAAPAEPYHIYVLARAGAGHFALPVEQVAEVLPAASVTSVPGAPPDMIGITHVRGRAVPVLAPTVIRGGTGLSTSFAGGVFIVINSAAGRFVLLVDAVTGIRRFPLSRIHVHTESEDAVEGRAGYLIDQGDRIIGLIDADRLSSAGGSASWRSLVPLVDGEATAPLVVPTVPMERLLAFRVGPNWCALDVTCVVQLAGYRTPVPVPESAVGIVGVVEIGADVVPVADLRALFGQPATVDDDTSFIVVRSEETRWALVVDRIDRLVSVPLSALHPTDTPIHPLVAAVVQVGHRLISVLTLAPLFEGA